jgi:hypothetical protein
MRLSRIIINGLRQTSVHYFERTTWKIHPYGAREGQEQGIVIASLSGARSPLDSVRQVVAVDDARVDDRPTNYPRKREGGVVRQDKRCRQAFQLGAQGCMIVTIRHGRILSLLAPVNQHDPIQAERQIHEMTARARPISRQSRGL